MGTQLPLRKKAQPHPTKFLAHMSIVAKRLDGSIICPGDVVLDGVAAPTPPPQKGGTAPGFRFMSIVAKRLDG